MKNLTELKTVSYPFHRIYGYVAPSALTPKMQLQWAVPQLEFCRAIPIGIVQPHPWQTGDRQFLHGLKEHQPSNQCAKSIRRTMWLKKDILTNYYAEWTVPYKAILTCSG